MDSSVWVEFMPYLINYNYNSFSNLNVFPQFMSIICSNLLFIKCLNWDSNKILIFEYKYFQQISNLYYDWMTEWESGLNS